MPRLVFVMPSAFAQHNRTSRTRYERNMYARDPVDLRPGRASPPNAATCVRLRQLTPEEPSTSASGSALRSSEERKRLCKIVPRGNTSNWRDKNAMPFSYRIVLLRIGCASARSCPQLAGLIERTSTLVVAR